MTWRSLLRIAGGLLAAWLAWLASAPFASAQMFGDRKQVECGNLAEGDIVDSSIEIVCGMSAGEFADNMRLALSPLEADKQELFRRLDVLLPESSKLQARAIRSFFKTLEPLGEAEVPPERLQDRFAEIATRHLALLEEIRQFRVQDPEIQALRGEAAAALDADPPDQDLARAKLEAARDLVRQKREAAAKLLADQQREEAQLVREQAGIEESRLRFAEAAHLYEEAASLLPADDSAQRWFYLMSAGLRWTDEGGDFGDNQALLEAIRVYRMARVERSRKKAPDDWATIQLLLGNALRRLGERESGTARLEQAVAAYRAALEESTRERVPLAWATTQNNLGNALTSLGRRESGTARLEQAVAAYRAALEEMTRGPPLGRAITQNNLGNALTSLGERESGTAHLEEAVAAFRAALKEYTRERAPLDWAMTQNNLGNALRTLGERENGTARLDEAVAAYREALKEYTRERVPLDWAMTQNNLGNALWRLGEREHSLSYLQDARAAVQAAYEVYVIEAKQTEYEDAFQARLADLERQITALKGGAVAAD